MKANFDELIQRMSEFLKSEAKTETIVGKEFKLGEYSCVPVMSIGMGIGGGSGEGTDPAKKATGEGGGIGGGMGLAPVGFLVSRGDQIQFIASKGGGAMSAAFEKLPDLLGKFMEARKEKATV